MRNVVIALFVLLTIAHQDFWAWDDGAIVLGFMPVGLFYHVMYAVASSALGLLAIRYMWPDSAHTEGESESFRERGAEREIGGAEAERP